MDGHSSRPDVAVRLKQPTREQRGPRQCSPIWSCSEWGLPCHATLSSRAVRSYRTVSPLPRTPCDAVRRSVLCCTVRRLTPPRRYLALCPMEPGLSSKCLRTSRPSGRLAGIVPRETVEHQKRRRPSSFLAGVGTNGYGAAQSAPIRLRHLPPLRRGREAEDAAIWNPSPACGGRWRQPEGGRSCENMTRWFRICHSVH